MDRYGHDILSSNPHEHGEFARYGHSKPLPAKPGLVVEEIETGWCGAVIRTEKSGGLQVVVLEDRHGRTRTFELGPGFLYEGEPVILTPAPARPVNRQHPQRSSQASTPGSDPLSATSLGPNRTNSGSRALPQQRAKVAKPSRIWVEGKHDAELVEHVWGDDLRAEGIVVCLLDGADNLSEVLAEFQPHEEARAGILLDHLVPGSKETRIAQEIMQQWGEEAVLITGHPFIDVWQAVKPARLGLRAWPEVPRGTDFKVGTLQALGWPYEDYSDVASAWVRILRSVRDYRDLEAAFLGRVEELIDFVTFPTMSY
ncbi:hypothetical protein BSR29_03340 [Boudabousia liubingyangii]|uniref:DUF3097 domain-containing protein n=1 Tax=Boudabousia liubingyangii TaxID=1921764 RepID=A0A1Q5PN54_9ACTO|nr:DUF3097 domain-containing protein [Boudabousia liubingyangii]OKL47473.1 hypothetical protein BSR28_02915 [Boudabousia liubingyangii]OKL48895.1 hypothetical protein BSR29_03340 [Boudabousia liubingyangii]